MFFAFYLIATLRMFVRGYRAADGLRRNQLRLVTLGTAAGFVGGQDGIEIDLELLPGDALADEVDVFAKELGIQHGPTLPNSPARGQRGIITRGGPGLTGGKKYVEPKPPKPLLQTTPP